MVETFESSCHAAAAANNSGFALTVTIFLMTIYYFTQAAENQVNLGDKTREHRDCSVTQCLMSGACLPAPPRRWGQPEDGTKRTGHLVDIVVGKGYRESPSRKLTESSQLH